MPIFITMKKENKKKENQRENKINIYPINSPNLRNKTQFVSINNKIDYIYILCFSWVSNSDY